MEEFSSIRFFNKLYNEYHLRFVRFANGYVRDLTLAEDIVMETFMLFWENKNNLKPESNIPGYILTIIKNKCLNHLQHQKTKIKTISKLQEHAKWELETRIASLEECNPDELIAEDLQRIVYETLRELPEQTRKIFDMSRFQNKSHKEIAIAFGITTKGIEFHIHKALKALRLKLKDYILLLFF